LLYSFVAIVIILLTIIALLYPSQLFTLNIGFSTTESTMDTILLVLATILLVLFIIRVITWLRGGGEELQQYQSAQGRAQMTYTQPADGVAIKLDGRELTIMDKTTEVPEALIATVHHVLSEHADEISRTAMEMQEKSGGDDLGGLNWLLAFLESIEAHVDEVRNSFLTSMARTAGSLVRPEMRRPGND
jgi:hypothetical protein